MAGSSFSYDSLDIGSRRARRRARRARFSRLAMVLLLVGFGAAWAHPGGGWGPDKPAYAHAWWETDHAGPPGPQPGDDKGHHAGDDGGSDYGAFRCMIDPSARSLTAAVQRTVQGVIRDLRRQYGAVYNGLHYSYTTDIGAHPSSPVTVTVTWQGSARNRLSGVRESANGTGQAEYAWKYCHWVQVGPASYPHP